MDAKFAATILMLSLAGTIHAADVPECTARELLGYSPSKPEIAAHRQFALPVVKYSHGTKLMAYAGGLALTLRIEAAGNVACFAMADEWGERQALNDQRRDVIGDLSNWRYAPFMRDGAATAAIVKEVVGEEELPGSVSEPPVVSLQAVMIGLQRSGCFGPCPAYKVELYGDGHAVFEGQGDVDVLGKHSYSIDPEVVAKLVDSMRTKKLWSLRDSYRAAVTDNSTYTVTLRLGDQVHVIEDYLGRMVGMPAAVTAFEDAIDAAAGSNGWINLSLAAVNDLWAEGFEFSSKEGGMLLGRAAANPKSDDDALVKLIGLGVSTDTVALDGRGGERRIPLIDAALESGHEKLAAALIERGTLQTRGTADQAEKDRAFHAAIAGGKLSLVQTIWDTSGSSHPALTFPDRGRENMYSERESPVTLLLTRPFDRKQAWQGREIAQWLAEKGCDLSAHGADGRTLLHIAAQAGDAQFVRYLLEQGVDPSTPGEFDLPAVGSAQDEEVAMLLLQAGSGVSARYVADNGQLRKFAEYRHWQRVIEWLDKQRSPDAAKRNPG